MKILILATLVVASFSAHAQTVQSVQRIAASLTQPTPVYAASKLTPINPQDDMSTGIHIVSLGNTSHFDYVDGVMSPMWSYHHGKFAPKLPPGVCDLDDENFGDCMAANRDRAVNMPKDKAVRAVINVNGQVQLLARGSPALGF